MTEVTEMTSAKKVRVSVNFSVDLRAYKSFVADYQINQPRPTLKTKLYDYWAFESMGLKKGDLAVVNTPSHGFTVALVHDVGDDLAVATRRSLYPSLKPILCKVDLEAFEKAEALDKRRQELAASLADRARKASVVRTMEDLLKDDPEAMAELKELKELGGV